jgi:hypothetical protein
MHDSEFVLVFRIDPSSKKICSFHYFVDTAAILRAWEHRGRHHRHG